MTIPLIDLSVPTVPTEDEILDGTIATFKSTISPSLNLDRAKPISLSTPQGQIAQAISVAFGGAYTAISYLINQFNPLYASGRFQDALLWMYFLTRREATKTVVTLTCRGLDGVEITQGTSQATDVYGRSFTAIQTVTISGGVAYCDFECDTAGVIDCPADTVNKIAGTPIGGWESCNNDSAGVTGLDAETQRAAEFRRSQSVKVNGHSQVETIRGQVLAVANVTDCYVDDNYSNLFVTKRGVSLKPHSIYVCVVGGTDTAVATAIYNSKSGGCDMNGDTDVVLDDKTTIIFQRANIISLYVRVKILQDATLPDTTTASVKQLIVDSSNGLGGQLKITIGEVIVANRFTDYIQTSLPAVKVLDIDVSLDGTVWTDKVIINADSIATVSTGDISVQYDA